MSDTHPFAPAASLVQLQRRAVLLQAVRNFFTSHGFWEAETPILSRDSCIDQWLDPFAVRLGDGTVAYLQTSPEFALKRLVCAGAQKVFEVARVFRQDEVGGRHNPEFTMIEWYQQQSDHLVQMSLVESLVHHLQRTISDHGWPAPAPPPSSPFARITYEQAFRDFAGVSPSQAENRELLAAAVQARVSLPRGIEEDREGLLNLLLAEVIEPQLQQMRAVFLFDFPAEQAALARIRTGHPPVAERFELYLDGMEICNGYHELTDADELRSRMLQQNENRVRAGKQRLPIESRLLQAMEQGMPPCAGVALGFDRLAAWTLGLTSIRDIIAFPFDRA